MNNLISALQNKINTENITTLLKTDKTLLKKFEKAYTTYALDNNDTDNFFNVNAKQAAAKNNRAVNTDCSSLVTKIVNELLADTQIWSFDGTKANTPAPLSLPDDYAPVTKQELAALPVETRPMLTGNLMSIDVDAPSSFALLNYLNCYQKTNDKNMYHRFRQGLDILDFDPLMYTIIDQNPNSMSHWLPQIAEPAVSHGFFKIPKTTIARIPLPLIQLTRKDYGSLTPTTIAIVVEFCMNAFNLDENKDYFIKTGTYSSKFDFRNAHVHGAKEVRELGEYLLFIHSQANQMAGPLSKPCVYGVSTTTEWVVREFIADKENNPCIYKGLPLHTEYRVFADFDTNNIIGISPYWEPSVMKKRFDENRDVHDTHDAVTYRMHENTLMSRYNDNKNRIIAEITKLLPDVNLHGQWSIDIMQNGDDFYIIDMALAETSAFYDCVPFELRKPTVENWLPDENTIKAIMSMN